MPSTPPNVVSYLRMIAGAWRNDPRDDAELLNRYAESRDETAFASLVWRHGMIVWRTCRHILGNTVDAEDAFQSAFLTLSRKANRLSVAKLPGWLHRVARQAALDVRKQDQRRQNREQKLRSATETKPDTRENAERSAIYEGLDEELAGLPEKLRVPLLLHYLEGKSQVEVARILGCGRSTLQERLQKGEAILRKRLEQRGLTLGGISLATLLGGTTEAATVPARLIESTAQAAVAFHAGTLSNMAADGAEKLLRSLSLKGVLGKGWWLGLMCVGALSIGGAGVVAWKMFGDGSDTASPLVREAPKIVPPQAVSKPSREHVDCCGDPLPEGALVRIGTLRFRVGTPLEPGRGKAAFLADGKTIVSMHGETTVHFWDTETGKELRRFHFDNLSGFRNIDLSPDGKKLVVVGFNETRVWDLSINPPRMLLRIAHKNEEIARAGQWTAVAFTNSGKTLAVSIARTPLHLFEVDTGKLLRTLNTEAKILAFSPDRKMLAADKAVWNLTTGKKLYDDLKVEGDILSLRFSPDNKMLASTTVKYNKEKKLNENFISLWNTSTGAKLWQIAYAGGSFLSFLPDGQTLLEISRDRRVHFRDPHTGKEKTSDALFCSHPEEDLEEMKNGGSRYGLGTMCLSPDGKLLVETFERFVSVIDLATGRQVGPSGGMHGEVYTLTCSPDNKLLATLSCGQPRLWELDTGRPGPSLERCNLKLLDPFWDKPQRWPLYFSDDHRIEIPSFIAAYNGEKVRNVTKIESALTAWDIRTGKIATIASPLGSPPAAKKREELTNYESQTYTLSAEGRWQLWGAKNFVSLVDRSIKKEIRCSKIENSMLPYHIVALSSDGRSILSCRYKDEYKMQMTNVIDVWLSATGMRLMSIDTESEQIPAYMALSPDGRRVAAVFDKEPLIHVWESASGTEVTAFQTADRVYNIAWSPDGRFIASGDWKGNVWVWDVFAGQEAGHFSGHHGGITSLAFSTDGLRLGSGSSDTTVLVWDMRRLQRREIKTERLPSGTELWTALGKKDATEAGRAMQLLTQNPDLALSLLCERLQLASGPDSKKVAILLTQLDNDDFKVRKQAAEQLEKLDEEVELDFDGILAKKPSPEVCQVIYKILRKQKVDPDNLDSLTLRQLQAYRAVEVLERIDTTAAREKLKELSCRLPAGSVPANEAKAALQRLTKPVPTSVP